MYLGPSPDCLYIWGIYTDAINLVNMLFSVFAHAISVLGPIKTLDGNMEASTMALPASPYPLGCLF
jgi:hypothetical protein